MPARRDPTTRPWLLAAPEPALAALAPLIAAHRELRPVRLVTLPRGHLPSFTTLAARLHNAAAALIVGNRRRGPRTAVPGLYLRVADDRRVPLGWLPDLGDAALARYAHAAAAVLRRPAAGLDVGPVALLSQWDDRALRVMRRAEHFLRRTASGLGIFRWTAERIVRRDLLVALRSGLGLALYAGHGGPNGWSGYQGLHVRHLAHARGEPLGAVLSICCETASRRRIGLSFCEALVLDGLAAAAVGAVCKTDHHANSRWVIDLMHTFVAGSRSIGALVCASPGSDRIASEYRILGDPLAPLTGAATTRAQAQTVFAPAPDDPLPPP